jgi:TetR/AcrR family transcriptional repressor of mexJK operon
MTLREDHQIARPGRPKSEEKRASIRESAARLFLDEGFERTSMDSIANSAGVSKQTVYSHFENKDELFKSCIEGKIRQYELRPDSDRHITLEGGLKSVADSYLRLLADPDVISMHRLVIAETPTQPAVARLFYASGPQLTIHRLAGFLERHAAVLDIDDYPRAAGSFMAMVADQYLTRLVLGLIDEIPAAERHAHVDRTVAAFLEIHGKA